jgi:hypothetical protein
LEREGSFFSDLGSGRNGIPGTGVGAIFRESWDGRYSVLHRAGQPEQSRILQLQLGDQSIVVIVFYAPTASHTNDRRLAFYEALHRTWRAVRQELSQAFFLLAGDANLPGLVKKGGTTMTPKDEVERYFAQHFCGGMKLGNTAVGEAEQTHRHGNVLDLILCDERLDITGFQVSSPLAGSDHRMVVVCVQHEQGEEPKTSWSIAKDAPWRSLAGEVYAGMGVLHEWARQRIPTEGIDQVRAQRLAASVAAFHSVLLMGTIWRQDSPYGTFRSGKKAGRADIAPWWSAGCARALND